MWKGIAARLNGQLAEALNDGRREGFVEGARYDTEYRFGEHADEIDYEVVSKRAEAEAVRRWPKETT